jgi:uncharacterized membrane protein
MAPSDLDSLDPDEVFADYERRARERRERHARRARTRGRGSASRLSRSEALMLAGSPGGRILVVAVAVLAVVTLAGLAILWPHGHGHAGPSQAFGGPTVAAKVIKELTVRCPGPTPQDCRRIVVAVERRPVPITLGPTSATPRIGAGTSIRVRRAAPLPKGVAKPEGYEPWAFADVDRNGSMRWLAIALAALAVIVLRRRGLLAVAGVGLSLLLMTSFLVPAILAGHPAVLVALVGSLAVMFVTLILTNGIGAQTMAAALGIASTLVVTAGLAVACVHIVHLDGHSSDLALLLSQQAHPVSLTGVVLASMVVGALGVLADTAVTQASAVMALRRADPALTPRRLYAGAIAVGRDHLSATIHTLVLAYTGAALPLLLLLRSTGVGAADAFNLQDVAEPVVATLVGCCGLILAVPLTTALAAMLVSRVPPGDLGDGHAHAH